MPSNPKRPRLKWVIFTLLACATAILATLEKHKRTMPRRVDIDKAAAHVTERAGNHFTKGVINAVKETLEQEDE